ncbi:hypothetical protein [Streptomyces lunaelactis]|uniref:hypothetical protein n=1 Tax=Streptomyces lunaelactis TaxID=1535768 RepID=UPI00158491A4|nr:hypothetical protein [Streptomyces lunaelactis]NUL14493.1 hypothetical protein [Streptomyces lunaelactis]
MAEQNSIPAQPGADHPARRLIAAGVKRGSGPLVVEQPTMSPADTYAARLLLAEQIIGFRIMKQTEVAPGWWGRPVEVGETGSGKVAHEFCMEQNRVTMNVNRPKLIQYFAEPIYAEPMSENDRLAHEKASHVRRTAAVEQPVLPPLPVQPAARRRAIALRGW